MKELSTRKAIFGTGKKLTAATNSSEFRRSIAIIIGIDKYSNGIPPLATAVNDATRLAQILKEQHGYSVMLLTDEEAALPRLQSLFCDEDVKNLSKDDRLLLYFAGHGVASDGDNGPEGFLIPQGAKLAEETFWPMTTLHSELEKLECRHMLAILDWVVGQIR